MTAARIRTILAEITQRCSDPNFDLDNAPTVLGLLRRYIQRLLEETGKSFTGNLVERRLERAFAMLTDPRHIQLTIIDIAFGRDLVRNASLKTGATCFARRC